jgi:hypothetical protein
MSVMALAASPRWCVKPNPSSMVRSMLYAGSLPRAHGDQDRR